MKFLRFCLLGLLQFNIAQAEELQAKPIELEFAGIPALNYTSDGGLGFGVLGSMYGKDDVIKPYVFAVDLQIFATTDGQQSHFLRLDWLEAFELPLRLKTRLGYFYTSNQNYCGQGGFANCDAQLALNDDYFLVRYSEKFGKLEGRWRLKDLPHRVELTASYRGSIYEPGSLDTSTPYPNSLFAADFPSGDRGYASVLELGVMIDNRDVEAAPASGYWIETSLRESALVFGSAWQYFGANLSARGYLAFDEPKRLVLAAQVIADVIIGDAPLAEIVRVGNSQGFTAFGGAEIGRGLREQYFPGRLKLLEQLELRYRFADFCLASQRFTVSALMFSDVGMVAWRIEQLETEPKKAIVGFGGGLRINWNTDFVVRLDVGVSPVEDYSPKVYLKVGNIF